MAIVVTPSSTASPRQVTALQIITRAMKIAGIIGKNETPDSGEADDGLIAINDMLQSWNVDRTYIYSLTKETFSLVSGTNSYTIGPSGVFNTVLPVKLDNVHITLNGIDFPLDPLNSQDYANIVDKSSPSGIPQFYYLDNEFPLSTLYLWGVPGSGLTITWSKWERLTDFPDLTTLQEFPPGYNRTLVYGLAKELAPEYGVSLTPEAMSIAMESVANIRNHNLPAPIMKTEIGYMVGNHRRFNIYSGY